MKVMTATRAAARKEKGKANRLHRKSVVALQDAGIRFLIGGAYVVEVYTGVSRQTKISIYIYGHNISIWLSMHSSARGTRRKKHFRIGWPKRNAAGIALI
jgi:hypothetical protein